MAVKFDDDARKRLREGLRKIGDRTKAGVKKFGGGFWRWLRVVAPPVLGWFLKHKAPVAIVLLVLYILLLPRNVPERKVADAGTPSMVKAPLNGIPATTQATDEFPTPQSFGDIPIYSPERPGFDPQWGLPAPLKGEDLQRFARQMEKLGVDTQKTVALEGEHNSLLQSLIEERIANLFWKRLLGKGFRDALLPLDWYELVKDRNGILASTAVMAEIMANETAQAVIMLRLAGVRIRVVGGQVIIGDQLFVKALQQYVDQRLGYLQKAVPQARSVVTRTGKEFQAELNQK